MKKFVLGIVAVLILALIVISGIDAMKHNQTTAAADTSATTAEATAISTGSESGNEAVQEEEAEKSLDYEAVKNAFAADEVVAKVNDKEITWEEYSRWIAYYARTVEENMQAYAMYGMAFSWDDVLNEAGDTYASYASTQAGNFLQQIYAVLNYVAENGIVVEDLDEQLSERIESDKALLGENLTDEQFDEELEKQHMSRAHYEQILTFNILYNEIFYAKFGENCELVDTDKAVKYLEDNGYYAANHILFLTGNVQTEEAYDSETIEAAKAKAEEISAELKAIEDKDELVARFLELKQELDEDSGKTTYPNGYIFKLEDMVSEFSDTVAAAKEYEVSDPVLSTYGFHVIMRLPLDPDEVITGEQTTARQAIASEEFSALLESMIEATNVELMSCMEGFTLANFIK